MTRIYQQYQRRISFISLLVIFAWGALGFRLFNIQVANGKDYSNRGQKQGTAKEILPALRGNIFDVNGIPLTRNITHYTIAADPTQVKNKQKLAKIISSATGKSSNYYLNKLNNNSQFTYLERNLKKKKAQSIIDKNLDGVIVQRNASRSYPQENIGGQLVGFTNVDNIGLSGIEQVYNKNLAGEDGWIQKQRTGIGNINVKNNYPKQYPKDGSDVKLTINIKYQSVLQEELQKQLNKTDAQSATGVIVNPQSGAILAIASVPDFNPNRPNKSSTKNQKIRAIADQFEPGSTFKIVTATAAIDKNIVNINDEFDCENGSFKYENITIGDHKPHNILNFGEIIEYSSNIGIIKVASKVGEKRIYNYATEYGFGNSVNIGLGSESRGTLRKLNDWSKISLAEIAMGHEVGVTAIQLAMAYSAIANGGILLQPYIVNNVQAVNGKNVQSSKPKVIRKIGKYNTMMQLSGMLEKAVENGTGIEAYISGWQVAGKTGTAQKNIDGIYSHTKFISNFVGFLPACNPQLLCVIVLDEPKLGYHWGATGAAPVFKKVMQRIINLDDSIEMPKLDAQKSILPEPILVSSESEKKVNNFVTDKPILLSAKALEPKKAAVISNIKKDKVNIVVPDVKGMSLKKAINTLKTNGLDSKFAGSGIVVWQSPKPGSKISKGSICSIGLE